MTVGSFNMYLHVCTKSVKCQNTDGNHEPPEQGKRKKRHMVQMKTIGP